MKNTKVICIIIALALVIGCVIFFVANSIDNSGKTTTQISREETVADLMKYVDRKIDYTEKANPVKGTVNLEGNSLEDELPDINGYPFKVKGTANVNVEIFSSPEKAGSETSSNDPKANTWLLDVSEQFNKKMYTTSDGKTVSVSIRSVSSGLACDYIVSGKYLPDAFTPSNETWVSMLKAKGVSLTQEEKCLVGNVAGIVLKEKTYNELLDKYGKVDIEAVIDATINGLAMGYTNPYASSTGLNFLVTSLDSLGNDVSKFQDFQKNVPVVSYNTTQMQSAINSGVLDAMILEYQTFINTPELRNYKFIPFGVRHDNPLYSIGNLSSEKKEALKLFAEFATNSESQKLATKYGFNSLNYVPNIDEPDGETLLDAQELWKKEKDCGQEIISVFVVDTSGSVDGAPLNEMKESLVNAAQYINPEHYIGLISYNSNVTINLPIDKFDLSHRAYFNGEVENLTASGDTMTFDAIAVALKMIEEAKVDHPNAKCMIFVLSDGLSYGSLSSVEDFIDDLNIPIHTIGYNANIAALREISEINEGAAINAATDDIIYVLKNLFNAQL